MIRSLFTEYPLGRRIAAVWQGAAVFFLSIAAGLTIGASARAEPGEDVVTLPVATDLGTVAVNASEVFDEIVVYGYRNNRGKDAEAELPIDPLKARVLDEIRELKLLEGEYEWRIENSKLDIRAPRLRIGYDPRNDTRSPMRGLQQTLPMDFVWPATLVSVDF